MSGWIRVVICVFFLSVLGCGSAPRDLEKQEGGKLSVKSRELTLASFNIKYYGTNGSPDGGQETRDKTLRDFIEQNLFHADVIVFEEIVDVEALKSLVKDKYSCVSYDARGDHQHVVLCYGRDYSFAKAPSDNNYTIEKVNLGGLRPAVHGILRDASGDNLAYIVGVHLKANPEFADKRLNQADILGKSMKAAKIDLPTFVLGDFNTYEDDAANIGDIFNDNGLHLTPADTSDRNTYRSPSHASRFDHIFMSDDLQISGDEEIHGPCNNRTNNDGKGVNNIRYYNTNISDHCPISVTVEL